MRITPLIQTLGRLAAAIGILASLLLLAGVGTAAADLEKPVILSPSALPGNVSPFPNCIDVNWRHSGGPLVVGFSVERENPKWGRDDIGADQRTYHVCDMDPSTKYRFRVCAIFAIEDAEPECSDWVELETGEPETPPASGRPPTPRIVSHQVVDQDTIGIRWEGSHDYDSFFLNYTLEAAPGASPNGPRTIHHDDDGTWGYQEVDGLLPGRTYFFQVQGCTETVFGILDDHCWDWSAPYPAQIPLPAAPPPSKPVITVMEPTARQINLRWDVVADERITQTVVHRDGREYYKVAHPLDRLEDGDGKVRPNTEYRYHVCLTNATATTCSDPVTAMTKPVAPTAPANVTAFRALAGAPVTFHWRNTEVPGQFLTVERNDTPLVPRCPPNTPVATCRVDREPFWNELQRISAKDDPTSVTIPETDEFAVEEGSEYRVCAVVPPLGEAGKVCSAPPVSVTTPSILTAPPRPLPPLP